MSVSPTISDDNSGTERMQVIKSLTGFACAHRHFAAVSHCRFVHGYERSFTLTIEGAVDPKTGWVIDFGAFQPLRQALENQFDHTLIIAPEDPLREQFEALAEAGGCQLRIMDHPGMEGAARWVWDVASTFIADITDGRARLVEVEAHESSQNAVRYRAE